MITVSDKSTYAPIRYFKKDWFGDSLICSNSGPWIRMIEAPNLGYKWLPGWGAGPLDLWLRIREILVGKYDLVYGFEHHPDITWPVYLTKPILKYTFISDWCDWFSGGANWFRGSRTAHKIDQFFEERIRKEASIVTTNATALQNRAIKLGIPSDRVLYICQGCDCEFIREIEIGAARRQLSLPEDVFLVGMVMDKYWPESLQMFKQVYQDCPNARLVIIGKKLPELLDYAKNINIDQAVIQTGWVTDEEYPVYLSAMDILFLVMKNDNRDRGRWPGKVNDYLAAGRPTIIQNVGDIALFLREHDAGFVVDDLPEMARKIVDLLKDPAIRTVYGTRARQVAESVLDWRVQGPAINEAVHKSLKMRGK